MKKHILIGSLFFLSIILHAQHGLNLKSQWKSQAGEYVSRIFNVEAVSHNPFINFQLALEINEAESSAIQVYLENESGKRFVLHHDTHMQEPGKWYGWTDLPNQSAKYSVHVTGAGSYFIPLQMRLFYPMDTGYLQQNAPAEPENENRARSPEACPCPYPQVVTRSQWCPNNQCPPNPNPVYTNVKFLIVHHTATPNNESDWAARVRQIWDYHVNTRGWADIGYNYLIDQNGLLYVGRGEDVKGAHFSGHNSETCGIAYLGTFSSYTPPQVMHDKFVQYAAYKCCDKNLDPLGTAYHASSGLVLHTIAGHRDSGSGTTCPGNVLYNYLPTLRNSTQTEMNQCDSQSVENATQAFMQIKPVPASDFLYLEYTSPIPPGNPAIFDLSGRMLLRFPRNVRRIPLNGLASGLYLIGWEDAGRLYLKKFIVAH